MKTVNQPVTEPQTQTKFQRLPPQKPPPIGTGTLPPKSPRKPEPPRQPPHQKFKQSGSGCNPWIIIVPILITTLIWWLNHR